MTDIKIKIEVDEELFDEFREFERKYGFNPCTFAGLIQNDMELPLNDVFDKLIKNRKIIADRKADMDHEFNMLMHKLSDHLTKLNPQLKQ